MQRLVDPPLHHSDQTPLISEAPVNPYVNFSDLAWYQFELPPLDEQRQLAGLLVAVSTVDAQLAQSLEAAHRLARSQSFNCFSALYDDDRVPNRQLGELLSQDISNGIFRKKEQFDAEGVPMINVSDVYLDFEVPLGALARVPVATNEYEAFSAKPGDVIFNRSSLVPSGIGHAGLVPEAKEKLVFECHLMRARPEPGKLDSRFLTHYALSPYGRRHLMSRAQTTTMTTIGQGDVREMIVPCPVLDEQKMIAANLDRLRSARTPLLTRRDHFGVFLRAILEGAFGRAS